MPGSLIFKGLEFDTFSFSLSLLNSLSIVAPAYSCVSGPSLFIMAIIPSVKAKYERDGSPAKWLTGDKYAKAPLTERALAWADALVGIREHGPNKGADVEEITEFAGLGSEGGYAWCAMFVYYVLCLAGFGKDKLPKRGKCAAVANWYRWANSLGILADKPKRGRLFLWLNSNQTGHIGFCLNSYLGVVFRTIEGNTDGEEGSREGDGSYKRTRTKLMLMKKSKYAFIDLEKVA